MRHNSASRRWNVCVISCRSVKVEKFVRDQSALCQSYAVTAEEELNCGISANLSKIKSTSEILWLHWRPSCLSVCFSRWRRRHRATCCHGYGGTNSSSISKRTWTAQFLGITSCPTQCGQCTGTVVWSTADWTRSDPRGAEACKDCDLNKCYVCFVFFESVEDDTVPCRAVLFTLTNRSLPV